MNTLAERLKIAMAGPPKIKQAELARACKISSPSVSDWLSGKTQSLNSDNLLAASKFLRVREDWLNSGRGPMRYETEGTSRGGISEWDSSTPLDDDEVMIPLRKEIEGSAGSGAQPTLPTNGRALRFSKTTLRDAGVTKENAECILVTGNSMEPRISDGATIGVDHGRQRVKDGRIYAIDHDGMIRVKYLYNVPGGGLRLHSENHDEHPDETYTAQEVAERIKVIGWVFWVSQMNVW